MRHLMICAVFICAMAFAMYTAPDKTYGQVPQGQAQTPSATSLKLAHRIAVACPGEWRSSSCLTAVSESTLVLAANYAATLQEAEKMDAVEMIKNHCAAATAAAEGDYPADAMVSAYTECANHIYDVSEMTGIDPDLSSYQVLVNALLCLIEDNRCAEIEQQFMHFR